MTQNKARFVTAIKNHNPFDKHAWEHTELVYEYRGHQYIVVWHNNGLSGTDETPSAQHRREQKHIDELIDAPKTIASWKYEGSAQEGFDIFWESVQ